ncbi:MAG: HAD family hydrolase [Gammaproteobacteria bacterium]|nr:HAD family hydrolase [Gammaproteobacteria bacterium]
MGFKALALDLDGTLLVGEVLPAENLRALREARDAGYRVLIATARWRQMALRIAEEIGVTDPVIACSGAEVYDPAIGEDVFDERLPADFAAELFALCDANRCIATVTFSERVLVKLDGGPETLNLPNLEWTPALTGAEPSLPRVAAIQGSAVVARIRSELEPKYAGRVHIADSIGPNGKIILTATGANASKGHALRAACSHMGIGAEQVVAFGDAENDIEMFNAAGASVAMGQADEATKQAATFVSTPNTEGGVARAVERLLREGSL